MTVIPIFFLFLCGLAFHIMKNSTHELILKKTYQTPSLRLIEMNLEDNLCGSSVPGGNEDIGYDDWD